MMIRRSLQSPSRWPAAAASSPHSPRSDPYAVSSRIVCDSTHQDSDNLSRPITTISRNPGRKLGDEIPQVGGECLTNPSISPHLRSATFSVDDSTTSIDALTTIRPASRPISIPPASLLTRRDPNRVATPVSGRQGQPGHCFPFSRSSSPQSDCPASLKKQSVSPSRSEEVAVSTGRGRRRSSSSSTRSHYIFSMHMESRYTPTSPLSPKLSGNNRPLSPQGGKSRASHVRQTSRNMHMRLPQYHPANYGHGSAATPSSPVQSPAITLTRVAPSTQLESPRMMREKHREFLHSVQQSSKTAASPFSQKPGSPRLDPLGSPKGPVTPLALEEASDYFAVAGSGKRSPATSPGGRSSRSDVSSGQEEARKNKREVDHES